MGASQLLSSKSIRLTLRDIQDKNNSFVWLFSFEILINLLLIEVINHVIEGIYLPTDFNLAESHNYKDRWLTMSKKMYPTAGAFATKQSPLFNV